MTFRTADLTNDLIKEAEVILSGEWNLSHPQLPFPP